MPRRTKKGKEDVEEMLAALQREAARNISEVEDEENYDYSSDQDPDDMRRDRMFDDNYFN